MPGASLLPRPGVSTSRIAPRSTQSRTFGTLRDQDDHVFGNQISSDGIVRAAQGGSNMAFDPNDRKLEDRNLDPRTPEVRSSTHVRTGSSSWVPWVAVIAVLLVGAFVWSQMGGSSTDPQTTSSTSSSTTDSSAPAPAPTTPAAPPAGDAAPATPPAGGAGGTGTQP